MIIQEQETSVKTKTTGEKVPKAVFGSEDGSEHGDDFEEKRKGVTWNLAQTPKISEGTFIEIVRPQKSSE